MTRIKIDINTPELMVKEQENGDLHVQLKGKFLEQFARAVDEDMVKYSNDPFQFWVIDPLNGDGFPEALFNSTLREFLDDPFEPRLKVKFMLLNAGDLRYLMCGPVIGVVSYDPDNDRRPYYRVLCAWHWNGQDGFPAGQFIPMGVLLNGVPVIFEPISRWRMEEIATEEEQDV